MIRRVTQVSVLAVLSALYAGEAHAHTVLLPQIDVGGQRKIVSVPHKHTQPASHPITAPRPSSPVVAHVTRSPAPRPAGGAPTASRSTVSATPPPDPNNSFQSSAQQDTALGPKINYPAPPKEMPASSERFFTGGQVNNIPIFRSGEALEIVPGLAGF